jgi:hypothetical protein
VQPTSSQQSSPIAKPSINIPSAPLFTAADLLQMANATMMGSYNQTNFGSIFGPSSNHLNGYPFAQLPPFFGE